MVGVAPPVWTWSALPLFQLSKYRKMPRWAHGVSTVGLVRVRVSGKRPFQSAKKNVLFFTIGPPTLSVASFRFVQGGVSGLPLTRLLAHVLGFSALFWRFHVAAPRNWLVPDRV